ncbi:cytidine deaminase [Petrotoga olearia]|uniref:Cytidine deaminase n=2 Tax=Petrotoga olearia TaxID=156203 RepID=A0A2K1P5K1_9BACT|nr:cytidine deaminase [Petrotoga olearia]PNR98070.1 cytidine deaminase [Petrotoga olearia DSM 13574]RMA75665.1 cytidine deaminase [Petrotoga olearia]
MKDKTIVETLYEEAMKTRENAYTPYSNFKVGASLLSDNGEIFSGCNVENASYGLSLCAERNTIFSAVARGERKFKAMLIVAEGEAPVKPCGACRQVMAEFGDFDVYLANTKGKIEKTKVSELLPNAFSPKDL